MRCRPFGSAHDTTALAVSDLGRLLSERTDPVGTALLAEGVCFAADEAYADSELLVVPWPGERGGDMWRDAYNLFLSSARTHIEHAFGQLVRRWGIFGYPLRTPFAKRPLLVKVAFLLHFFRKMDSTPLTELHNSDGWAGERVRVDYNDSGGPDAPRARAGECGS